MTKHNPTVRQVLMNELGLTREAIKEEMYNIIREEIQKELQKPEFIHLLAKAILRDKGTKWDIVNLSSSRITATILRKFESFVANFPEALGDEWEKRER